MIHKIATTDLGQQVRMLGDSVATKAKLSAVVLNDVKASESVFEARSRGKRLRSEYPQISRTNKATRGPRDDRK